MMVRWLVLIAVLFSIGQNESARILGVFPMPSLSHQVVFRALFYELAKRGHEVVLVTPHPGAVKDRPDNVTEIDTSYCFSHLISMAERLTHTRKRGVVFDNTQVTAANYKEIIEIVKVTVTDKELQRTLNDKSKKFDLIMTESVFLLPMAFAKIYNLPLILMSSMYGSQGNFANIGAPTRHPFMFPNFYRDRLNHLSLWEKFEQMYTELRLWREFHVLAQQEMQFIQEIFGENAPTWDELIETIDMLFLNVHSMFDGNRPVPPNTLYFGALHMKPLKELPQEIKSYLDNSKRGVVYVSLGTNVQTSYMSPDLLEVFLQAFKDLPYDILWKCDSDNLQDIPKNVRAQKWFPQRDLLPHPNIKAFVMQGGLQSMDEAIDAGVPLVTIPALGDQWYNAERFEQFGIGIKLDMVTLQAEDIVKAVHKVIEDKSYRANMRRVKTILKDQPESPMERAVWWTEYVIRNKGAKHLRATSFNMSWSDYLMLDVVLVVLGAAVTALTVAYFALKKILRLVCKGRQPEKAKLKKK